jgi:cytosine/adenosine deaminase-related metal-dependent hydrolase
MNSVKVLRQKVRLWPTLMVRIEIFPWHWVFIPWGYVHFTGGFTFLFEWLGIDIHFGCTMTPRTARKLKKAKKADEGT